MALDGKAVAKIWELATTYVLPSFLTPAGTRLRGIAAADARAHEIRALAQAEKDAEDIRTGRARLDNTVQLIPVSPLHSAVPIDDSSRQSQATPTVIEEARTAADLQNLQKHINERRALVMAAEEAVAIPDERVSDEPPDSDWFAMWRDGAQGVSNEEMRRFWARILAGEAAQPHSYSLRTLDALRRFTLEDAHLVEQVAPFVIDGEIAREIITDEMLSLTNLYDLAEMGIVTGAESITLQTQIAMTSKTEFKCNLICNDKVVVVYCDDPNKKLFFRSASITRVGRELISLGNFRANEEYLDEFVSLLEKQGFSVHLEDVAENESDGEH